MAIDPVVLQIQQRGPPMEYACPECGRRTRDKQGRCGPCRRAIPDLARYATVQVVALGKACRQELERRQKVIADAFGDLDL